MNGPTRITRGLFAGYAAVGLLCLGLGLATGAYWLVGLPVFIAVAAQVVLNFRPLFWMLLVMIPLGTEVYLPGGLGTDLPTEPIAVGLTAIFLLHALRHWPTYGARYFLHPIALLLYLHVGWILFTSAFAEIGLISLKFSLAKLWYIGAFFLLPLLLLRSPGRVTTFAHCVFWPLLFVAVQTLVRHAAYDFSFADQFRTMHPFMRNHVSYAGCLAAFTPWCGYLLYRYRIHPLTTAGAPATGGRAPGWLVYGIGAIWFLAIYFAYTRAAYVALALAGVAYFVIRWRMLAPVLGLALVVALGGVYYLVGGNRYLEYAPDYATTIAHERFDNLISATYKLEDISTMERFYRWVAGGNMVPYRPLTGHGPGNFVELYRGYTVDNFQTYVSDNPERSGIHNYYLMTLVEQGYPGLLFLLVFLVGVLLWGERLYHRQTDPLARAGIMAALLSLIIVDAFSLINDLLETDKVGSLFFLSAAIVVTLGRYRVSPPATRATAPPPPSPKLR